ncbi:hypothetical protein [Methylocystis parvus]|uniref:hypothetical protein n=1 Tax=Methylocystis parvus TaxID=134 RepID=UPI003C723D4F
MSFLVQFLSDAERSAKPRIVRTVNFEAEDLYSVVSRIRTILSTRGYEPSVNAFQVLASEGRVVHYEHRDESDVSDLDSKIGSLGARKGNNGAQGSILTEAAFVETILG